MKTMKYQQIAIPLFARDRFICSLFSIYPNLLKRESYPSAKLLKKSDICVIIDSQNAGMRQGFFICWDICLGNDWAETGNIL